MAKFKVGDKVKIVRSSKGRMGHICDVEGRLHEYILIDEVRDLSGNNYSYTSYNKDGDRIDSCSKCLGDGELAYYSKSSKNNMNLVQKVKTFFLNEPEKSFVEAGIMNEDQDLTEEGQEIFLAWLLKKNGADFKKEIVDLIIADAKKDK